VLNAHRMSTAIAVSTFNHTQNLHSQRFTKINRSAAIRPTHARHLICQHLYYKSSVHGFHT